MDDAGHAQLWFQARSLSLMTIRDECDVIHNIFAIIVSPSPARIRAAHVPMGVRIGASRVAITLTVTLTFNQLCLEEVGV